MKNRIEVDIETYVDLLNQRRKEVRKSFDWTVPNVLWDWFIETIRENGISGETDPMIVVDNAIVNGDWGEFDNYKNDKETDDEFVARVEEDALFIDKNERLVCFSI